MVTWGGEFYGNNDNRAVVSQLNGAIDVTQIFTTYNSFAALRDDGSVVTWGTRLKGPGELGRNSGGDSSLVASKLNGDIDVTQIVPTSGAFAALREDGIAIAILH